MAAVAITTTTQDIEGDFDVCIRGDFADVRKQIVLLKALGAGGTNFLMCKMFSGAGHYFVKNTGSNAYKLMEAVSGVVVEFNQ